MYIHIYTPFCDENLIVKLIKTGIAMSVVIVIYTYGYNYKYTYILMIVQLLYIVLFICIYFGQCCLASLLFSFVANTKHSVYWMA